jgi:DNA-binding beta-propeller fold protein YncE
VAGDSLYIADTENHLLRKADLAKRTVVTVAGTGEKGSAWTDVMTVGGGTAKHTLRTTPLSSPWALCVHGQDLFIAMAGMHQIWRMPLDESTIGPYAGNAREDIENGPLLPTAPYDTGFASFAQPSGLSSDGNRLFVADSEGSTVRSVPFDPKGNVDTLVGLTGTLFDFGDKDGTGSDVRLQHPLDVCWCNGELYVADTYNNKIKVIDVEKQSCRTLAGTGQRGSADAAEGARATFIEPAGITAAGGKLYVADTNNHAIRVVDLSGTNRVSTLKIDGLAAPLQK